MLLSAIFLFFSLVLILIAAEGFTNGVESLGKKLSLTQAVVGSVLAAVGTALPETILPIVAILSGSKETGKDIGIGAILGAPFMLSTLAFFLVGLTVTIMFLKKQRNFEINIEYASTKRDLMFFIPMYASAVFIPMFAAKNVSIAIAVFLVLGYIFYVRRTMNAESATVEHLEGLHIHNFLKYLGVSTNEFPGIFYIILQITLTLAIMVTGAHIFVKNIEVISTALKLNPLIFALILAPIATELPEKFNSISWTLKNKDALAFGNITGAMVFQSTFPVSVGLLFTNWQLTGNALFSAIIALISAIVVLTELQIKKKITPYSLLFGGALYLVYVIKLFY